MNIAIIPARGGSKRIPRKNIKEFFGKPIIAYSIQAAIDSGLFDKIIVSTDDEEIANISRKYGADVPFVRPQELADDHTGTNAVVKHALEWLSSNGRAADYACCIYATAPFIDKNFLIHGYNDLVLRKKKFAFTVTSFPHPVQRALRINQKGEIEALFAENNAKRSQDLEEAYHDAGQFYWGTSQAFLEDEVLFSTDSIPVVLPRYLVQDIDTLEDWRRAEFMYHAMTMEAGKL